MGVADRPEAMSLAHRGLTEAYWRTLDAARRKRLLSCAIASTESLHWLCALDEQLEKEDGGYKKRRDQDDNGKVIPGLRYGRDRAMHQVVVCAAEDVRSFFRPRAGGLVHIASSYPIWAPTATLPMAEKKHHHQERLAAYEQHVAEHNAWRPIFKALEFLTQELTGKIDLISTAEPTWFEELTDEERDTVTAGPLLRE